MRTLPNAIVLEIRRVAPTFKIEGLSEIFYAALMKPPIWRFHSLA